MARIILTRPLDQAEPWAEALRAFGHEVVSFPLIEIAWLDSPQDQQERRNAWAALPDCAALMFVSAPAVQGFFMKNRPLALADSDDEAINNIANSCSHLRLWATGPGTVRALQALGWPSDRIDAPGPQAEQFDSEALWRVVQLQVRQGAAVMIVRGRDAGAIQSSRDWLAQQVQAAGGTVQIVQVYERRAPQWTPDQLKQSQRWLDDGSIWLLSSSQGLRHLPAQLDASRAQCLCTHERIAQAAVQRGFAVVCTSRPNMADVAASIKSLHERSTQPAPISKPC